jgi:hypothetical protein
MAHPPLPLGEHGAMSLASRRRPLGGPLPLPRARRASRGTFRSPARRRRLPRLALQDELRAQRGPRARPVAAPARGATPSGEPGFLSVALMSPVTNSRSRVAGLATAYS